MTVASEITAGCKKQHRPRGYIPNYNPHRKTRALVEQIQHVLEEYREHWPLTARQVFYRLVGAYGADKSNKFYQNLIGHLGNARRGKVVPFQAIRDDGVSIYAPERFADVDAFRATVNAMAANYRRDLMANQEVHCEVWCEAGGMLPQLAGVAGRYSIKCYSSGGFDSLTAKKDLADRICESGKPCIILHLGDYDKSGVDIFKSITADVSAFVAADRLHAMVNVEFRRIALTEDQVNAFNLPTAPAKPKDIKSQSWTGGTCQLEALAPDQIADLLRAEISTVIDQDTMRDTLTIEQYEREQLTQRLLR